MSAVFARRTLKPFTQSQLHCTLQLLHHPRVLIENIARGDYELALSISSQSAISLSIALNRRTDIVRPASATVPVLYSTAVAVQRCNGSLVPMPQNALAEAALTLT
jgi:hypothetical protein